MARLIARSAVSFSKMTASSPPESGISPVTAQATTVATNSSPITAIMPTPRSVRVPRSGRHQRCTSVRAIWWYGFRAAAPRSRAAGRRGRRIRRRAAGSRLARTDPAHRGPVQEDLVRKDLAHRGLVRRGPVRRGLVHKAPGRIGPDRMGPARRGPAWDGSCPWGSCQCGGLWPLGERGSAGRSPGMSRSGGAQPSDSPDSDTFAPPDRPHSLSRRIGPGTQFPSGTNASCASGPRRGPWRR